MDHHQPIPVNMRGIARIHPRKRDLAAFAQARAMVARPIRAMSRRRRIAAAVPLVVALAGWFAVPTYASTYQYSLERANGLVSHGNVCLWTDKGTAANGAPHYRCPVYGYNYAGDFVFHRTSGDGPGTIYGYCVNLEKDAVSGEILSDSGNATAVEAYIVSNYFPYGDHPGALDTDSEAAAVQIAIWGFTNDTLSDEHPPIGVPAAVVDRARAIDADASAHADAWLTAHNAAPGLHLTVSGSPATLPAQTSVTVTAHVENPAGIGGLTVTFHVNGGAAQTVPVTSAGTAEVTLTRDTPGTDGVEASLNGYYRTDGGLLVPNVVAQSMAYQRHIPASASASTSAEWVSPPPAPKPGVAKSITDVETGTTSTSQTIATVPGDHLRFDITYTNTGNAPLSDARVTDDLAQNNLGKLTNVVVANNGTLAGGVITWPVGTVAAGAQGVVSFTAQVPAFADPGGAGLTFCNAAQLGTTSTPPAPITSNQVCAHASTQPQPHIVATKTVDGVTSDTVNLGDTLTYGLTVKNDGNRDISGVAVSDVLTGHNLDLLGNVAPADGGTYNATTRTVTWSVASLAAGSTVTLTFTAQVPAHLPHGVSTCFINAGMASGGGVSAITNTVSTCVHPAVCAVPSPAVTISGPTGLTPGSTVTYTVHATNGGVAQLSDNVVTVTVPSAFTVTGAPGGTIAGNVVTFDVGPLGPAQSVIVTVTAHVPSAIAQGNQAASVTMTGTDAQTTPDCPHPSASTTATWTSAVGGVLGVSTGPVSAVLGISTPSTGAGGGLLRTTLVGLCLLLSGLIILTTPRTTSRRR